MTTMMTVKELAVMFAPRNKSLMLHVDGRFRSLNTSADTLTETIRHSLKEELEGHKIPES